MARSTRKAPSPKSTQAKKGRDVRKEHWALVQAEGSRYVTVEVDVDSDTVIGLPYDLFALMAGRAGLSHTPETPDDDAEDLRDLTVTGANQRLDEPNRVEPGADAAPADEPAATPEPAGDTAEVDSAGAETVDDTQQAVES